MTECKSCSSRGGLLVSGGPGACERCGRIGAPGQRVTVAELVSVLQRLPQDAPVGLVWDGADRTEGDGLAAWSTVRGRVLIGQAREVVYYPDDWPSAGFAAGPFPTAADLQGGGK